MSSSATVDRPERPRPIFECLPSAVGAAIRCGNTLSDINPDRWSITYGCTSDDVRAAFLKAQTKETNAAAIGDGK